MGKTLIIVTVSFLIGILFSQNQNRMLRKELALVADSLNEIKRQQHWSKKHAFSNKFDTIIGKAHLIFNSESKEYHRISANYGQTFFDIRFFLKSDSSVLVITVKYSEKHPLTGVGSDTIYSTTTQQLDYSVLKEFRERLSKVTFMNAIKDYSSLCCFGGGTIQLESRLSKWEMLKFSTYCRESTEFAEACEYLMQHVNDEELRNILKSQDLNFKIM